MTTTMTANLPESIDHARVSLNTLAAETANIADIVAMAFGLPMPDISGGARDLPGAVVELAQSLDYVSRTCAQASQSLVGMRLPRREAGAISTGEIARTIYGAIPLSEPTSGGATCTACDPLPDPVRVSEPVPAPTGITSQPDAPQAMPTQDAAQKITADPVPTATPALPTPAPFSVKLDPPADDGVEEYILTADGWTPRPNPVEPVLPQLPATVERNGAVPHKPRRSKEKGHGSKGHGKKTPRGKS